MLGALPAPDPAAALEAAKRSGGGRGESGSRPLVGGRLRRRHREAAAELDESRREASALPTSAHHQEAAGARQGVGRARGLEGEVVAPARDVRRTALAVEAATVGMVEILVPLLLHSLEKTLMATRS